jgi:hypothetical protein
MASLFRARMDVTFAASDVKEATRILMDLFTDACSSVSAMADGQAIAVRATAAARETFEQFYLEIKPADAWPRDLLPFRSSSTK